MKFKYKQPPKTGDKRTRRRFAWWKTAIDGRNGKYVIWLEFYYQTETFFDIYGSAYWMTDTKTQISPLEEALK